MQISTPYDDIRDTPYDVRVNPGHRNPDGPFAVIDMGDGCRVQLAGHRADMERLLAAAATAIGMLAAGDHPHPWAATPGHDWCGACGRRRPDPVHDTNGARDDTWVRAEPEVPRSLTSLRCHRHPERAYGACPECSADIDAAIARDTLARDIAAGTPTLEDDFTADPKHDPHVEWLAGDDSAADAQVRADDAAVLARDIAAGVPTVVDDDLSEFCGRGEPAGHDGLHGAAGATA